MTRLILIAAQSLDGFIAKHDHSGTDFCSPEDRAFLASALKDFDSMIMGRATFQTLQERISASKSTRYLRKIMTRQPERYADLAKPDLIEFTNASPAEILAELAARGRQRCALLGGGETYSRFLDSGLVDELWLTLEPLVFGSGTPLATGRLENRFRLASMETLGENTILLRYRK
ncbi:dihydrofolate reductase family protein [Pelagicoccus sp. SDUM812003]|uniref:dihydrofolate reductase family protein n=1 Tax=Pelagicoccus sp. SDUM812003 TaxID=3041267 RepID=UPI0028106473|nr:dihydrofolate reductase family protein [Pelagicoccus sp. SDUM812003]MDQ8202367.1 dihydrofolate reductase family protein [Pelagicoccus sp. SDUM812003]